MTPAQRQAILATVKAGNKIEAIKLSREAAGMSLAEAKDFVEQLEMSPNAPQSPAGNSAGALAPIADLLFKSEKISAIKLYREQVKPGIGLAEAKLEIERLEAGLRAQHPEKFTAPDQKFTAPAQKYGCMAALAVLAALFGVLMWFLF